MVNYWSLLLCASALAVTESAVLENIDVAVNDIGHYSQIVPDAQERVEIKVYYECYCPGCIVLHTGALPEVMQKLGSYLDYKSYPYGNAKMVNESGKVIIHCQHGEQECYGNKLHACAIDTLNNATHSEEYISCMMSGHWGGKGSTDKDATNCGKKMGISAQPIIKCAKGQKGQDLLEYYGKETAKIHNTYVPYILINGKVCSNQYSIFMYKICGLYGRLWRDFCLQMFDDDDFGSLSDHLFYGILVKKNEHTYHVMITGISLIYIRKITI